jgi:transcription antitermination factor NusG
MLLARIRQDADEKEQNGKPQMARKTRFAADSIERYFGSGYDIPLCDVDRPWLDTYLEYLQHDGKTDNTISNYLRVLQTTFRRAAKAGLALDLTLFAPYFTGNSKSTRTILTVNQVKTLVHADLDAQLFARTRDLFALCLFGGGLSIAQLREDAPGNPLERLRSIPEVRSILAQYNGENLLRGFGGDPCQAYLHNLSGIAAILHLGTQLTDDTAAESWAEVAKQLGIPHRIIATVVGRPIANLNYAPDSPATPEEVDAALRRVAGYIGINPRHWFAIRCYDAPPADVATEILTLPRLKTPDLKHFCLEDREQGKKYPKLKNYMQSVLFVHCLDTDALYIRRTLSPGIYVYDYTDGEVKTPAPISDQEMRTFMYLADVSGEDILFYFPEELDRVPTLEKYQEVVITQGPFSGITARVQKQSKDKLKVLVRFQSLNGYYTAEIPANSLTYKLKKHPQVTP